MLVRNFLETPMQDEKNIHEGTGTAKHVNLFNAEDFATNIGFINYTILHAGSTIGLHTHGQDEELYMVLEGSGIMTVNGDNRRVTAGDIIVNPPNGTHGLVNDSECDLRLLVLEAYKG